MELLLEIARCPIIASCLAEPAQPHPCAKIVMKQGTTFEQHQIPEPWCGDLEHAPILFVSSNPSITSDSYDRYPRSGWADADITDYFANRFHGSSKIWVDPQAYRKVQYWAEVQKRASELLGRQARPGIDFALTEVVHCKSRNNFGVDEALDECSKRYLSRVLEASGARVIVVLGNKARFAVERRLGISANQNPFGPVRIGKSLRYVTFLAQPGSAEPRTFARCLPNDIDALRVWASGETTIESSKSVVVRPLQPQREPAEHPVAIIPAKNEDSGSGKTPRSNPGEFLRELQARAAARGYHLHDGKKIDGNTSSTWTTAGAGKSNCFFSYVIGPHSRVGIELWINRDPKKVVFSDLLSHLVEIEAAFGHALLWERQIGQTSARVQFFPEELKHATAGVDWLMAQTVLINAMNRFSGVLRPYLRIHAR